MTNFSSFQMSKFVFGFTGYWLLHFFSSFGIW